MENLFIVLTFLHIIGFVFMSLPLFNLIVVNERALMGASFNYASDRYMENIIKHGAKRCYVFQSTVLVTGVLLLVLGPLGIESLWLNGIILAKTILLFTLMGLLSYVHLSLQPKIESFLIDIGPDSEIPEGLSKDLKPYRVMRKRLATFCLFLVIIAVFLGMQVYHTFGFTLNIVVIGLTGLFAWRVNKSLILFGWI